MLLEDCLEGLNPNAQMLGIYMNDPKMSFKEEDNVAPYAFGILLEAHEYEGKKNLPIRIF